MKRIMYRNRPFFLAMRIIIDLALLTIDNRLAYFIIMIAGVMSLSTKYVSEEEYLIPLTYDEMKKRRLAEVKDIMLRAFLLMAGNTLISYFIPALRNGDEFLSGRPFICLAIFILCLVELWSCLIDSLVFKARNKAKNIGYNLLEFIPVFLIGGYCFRRIDTSDSSFFYKGPEWVHIMIIAVIAVAPVINAVRNIKKWQFHDFIPDMQNVKNVAAR
ncbi:MAG: hypothetical protein IK007_10175 [Lachnospiraceae bacterium]|nr:hypothetical protein [Lachnospiraceae bacterium]